MRSEPRPILIRERLATWLRAIDCQGDASAWFTKPVVITPANLAGAVSPDDDLIQVSIGRAANKTFFDGRRRREQEYYLDLSVKDGDDSERQLWRLISDVERRLSQDFQMGPDTEPGNLVHDGWTWILEEDPFPDLVDAGDGAQARITLMIESEWTTETT